MGDFVTYASNGGTSEGYLALPKSGAGPAVVVIQEWWGLVPHITDLAERFAAAGFVTLAPDLFHGAKTTERIEGDDAVLAAYRELFAIELTAIPHVRGS